MYAILTNVCVGRKLSEDEQKFIFDQEDVLNLNLKRKTLCYYYNQLLNLQNYIETVVRPNYQAQKNQNLDKLKSYITILIR